MTSQLIQFNEKITNKLESIGKQRKVNTLVNPISIINTNKLENF